MILFSILNRFKINKKLKKCLGLRAGPAWMRRGMQGHLVAARGPVQRLRGALGRVIKMGLQPSLVGKGY